MYIDEVDCFSFGEVSLGLRDELARISGRVLGDRGCARCRNGDLLMRRSRGDFG